MTPQISLTHWVKLKLHDCNNWYSACTVDTLVAPGLCDPSILGLSFLHRNNIMVNGRDSSAIDMTLNFDLLHPVAPPVHKPIMKLRDIIKTNVSNRKLLVNELKEMCAVRQPLIDARCEHVNSFNVIAAICGHIEQLAAVEHLEKLNDQIHKTYADVFKLIPHIDEMPDMVQCKIKLKDATKTISTCSYLCPQKFHEAWSILIQ